MGRAGWIWKIKKELAFVQLFFNLRAPGMIRTCDTRFRKPVLYPLSYEGINLIFNIISIKSIHKRVKADKISGRLRLPCLLGWPVFDFAAALFYHNSLNTINS